MARSLRMAKELAPDLFSDVNKDTPLRWKSPEPSTKKTGECELSSVALMKLADIARATSIAVPVSAPVYLKIFEEQLQVMEIDLKLHLHWVQSFLRELGLTWGRSSGDAAKQDDPDSIEEARENFRLKIVFIRHKHDISADRVVNIDQTSVRVLPTGFKGWKAKGTNPKWAVDSKRQVTVTLACFMERPEIYGQIVFNGKTAAVHPAGNVPDELLFSHSENHWSSAETMHELVTFLDGKINAEEDDAERPWIMSLDVAPVHVGKEFRALLADNFAWVRTPYVKPKMTFCSQPLDLTYMRSFKCALANAASMDFARQVVAGFDEENNVQFNMRLSALKPKLVCWVRDAISVLKEKAHLREKGWQHVRVTDEAWDGAVSLAEQHHSEERLFQKCQTGIIPEMLPVDGEQGVADDVEGDCHDDEDAVEDDGHEIVLLADAVEGDGAMEEPELEQECVMVEQELEQETAAAPPPNQDLTKLQRLMALRLIYGQGPPASK
jgi:hypothetical protein